MKSSTIAKTLIFILVLLLAVSQEGECRRKILKGRKAITRTYYRYSAVPPWVIVIIVGICEIVFGAILFVLLKFCLLDNVKPYRYINPRTQKYAA